MATHGNRVSRQNHYRTTTGNHIGLTPNPSGRRTSPCGRSTAARAPCSFYHPAPSARTCRHMARSWAKTAACAITSGNRRRSGTVRSAPIARVCYDLTARALRGKRQPGRTELSRRAGRNVGQVCANGRPFPVLPVGPSASGHSAAAPQGRHPSRWVRPPCPDSKSAKSRPKAAIDFGFALRYRRTSATSLDGKP